MIMLTQERLKQFLHYDPETGAFTRLLERGGRRKDGRGGRPSAQGYLRTCIDCRVYYSHRLAWYYVHGVWAGEIDHIDGDRANNRISNLRPATRTQNLANSRRSSANTSGFKGVSRCRDKWRASIRKDGKSFHLGVFDTREAAADRYAKAATEKFGEFGRAA